LLGATSLEQVNAMTLEEYAYRMRAYSFLRLGKLYDMHLQAWLNRAVKATKFSGKKEVPVYKEFKSFFDYEKEIKHLRNDNITVSGLSEQQLRMAKMAEKFNKGGG